MDITFLDHNIVGKRGRDKDLRGYVLIGLSDDIVRTLHIPCPIFVLGSCIINPRRECAAKVTVVNPRRALGLCVCVCVCLSVWSRLTCGASVRP